LDIASFLEVDLESTHDLQISDIKIDSRDVKAGDLFVAMQGYATDGHQYIDAAINRGASAVLCSEIPAEVDHRVAFLQVENTRKVIGGLCRFFYDDPSSSLTIIAVTGTNGKTTVASSLYEVARGGEWNPALLSTIRNEWQGYTEGAKLTTPDVVSLNRMFREMVLQGITHVFMEVSSHALDQGRVDGINFSVAVFTNISRDHLDYHGNMRNYLDAKKLLFDNLTKEATALVNQDDKNSAYMLQNCRATKKFFGLRNLADYKGKILSAGGEGMQMEINNREFNSRLIGDFNASNVLAVYGVMEVLGMSEDDILSGLSRLKAPSGRMEIVSNRAGIHVIVDYAHTPDALSKVLQTIEKLLSRDQKIYTVVGCGGDRDKGKRPQMAKIACRLSNMALLTSDNPRSEDPVDILSDMERGLEAENYETIVDRKDAIRRAVELANRGDFVLIAGKGHETYQEINEVRNHFDDREVVAQEIEMIYS